MVPKSSYPPSFHHAHLTKTLPPSQAQKQIANFLNLTSSKPHLHPDSLLYASGISFSATSGPRGGLALHHLKRVEAGLRGENLVAESKEELDALFGEDGEGVDGTGEGDDRVLDALIDQTEGKLQGGGERGKKRKRREEITEWAENSSQAGAGAEVAGSGYGEVESFAATPLHQFDWQEQEEYELQQRPMQGEVGEREGGAGATMVKQNGAPPDVVEHDEDGEVVKKKKSKSPKTAAEKEARKGAKREKKEKEKRKKIREAEKGKG